MFKRLREDIQTIKERDPAARNAFEIFFMYSGLHAIWWYRASHWCYRHKRFSLARFLSQCGRFWTGIEIHPGATIGKGLFIDHGMGVVIGETTEIGNNVLIGSGAKVLGPFTVGDNSKIAANAVVLSEIPPNSTCVGVPARVVKIGNKRVCPEDLDQVHIPDPVSMELCKLCARLDKLEKKLKEETTHEEET